MLNRKTIPLCLSQAIVSNLILDTKQLKRMLPHRLDLRALQRKYNRQILIMVQRPFQGRTIPTLTSLNPIIQQERQLKGQYIKQLNPI